MADTEQPELSLARFRALVEAYGGDVERFPSRERAAARELLLRSADARMLADAARTFDAVLMEARADVTPSSALLERLDRIPELHAQKAPLVRMLPFRSLKQTWLLAAAALLLGVLGGELSEEPAESVQAELGSLTFADDLLADMTVEGDAQ